MGRRGVVSIEAPVVSFAGLLRRLRAETGLTQEELAEAAGVGVRTVSDLERGVALTARKETAQLLADALGLDGAARASFEATARGRSPAAASPTVAAAAGVAAGTQTLPRDIASFTGREPELRRLTGAVTGAGSSGGVVSIHAIGGMAGIGKTALAVHAAHQLAPRFPDGQVFLPLHGHTPGRPPVAPEDALASLLLIGGLSPALIPPGLEARMALWRDHLAGKQLLLLLDDAAGHEQVAPLLPGSAGSLVLVTSRRHLTALEDARSISLDTLPADEAAELLARLADRPGLAPEDPAVAEITGLCGYLPLAVGMLARQLHHHPAWTVEELADDLVSATARLELMHAEDLSVAAAFDLSYAQLTAGQQQLFRRLGVHPGTDIDAYAAATLDDTDLATARRHLDDLYERYLLAEPARGRYRFHDLIREHARSKAAADPPAETDAALIRLLDYYQHTAATAEALLGHQTRTRPGPVTVTARPATIPDLPDRTRALAWARTERASLLACLDHATRVGQHERVVALTAAIAALLRLDGPWTDAITRHATAVQAARHLGDRPTEAGALIDLGDARYVTDDYPGAVQMFQAALGIYRDLGDRQGRANALSNLGIVRRMTGDYPFAAEALEEALGIYRDLGDRRGQANALSVLGSVREEHTRDYPGAAEALEEALGISRDLGDRRGEANALGNLGVVREHTGDYSGAAEAQEDALGISRNLGNRLGQANALSRLGNVRRLIGDYQGAAEALEEALGIFRDLGDRQGQANALNNLGIVRRQTGDYPGATLMQQMALGIFRDLGNRGGEAETLSEMGTLHRVRGDLEQADTCHRQSLALAREIGSPWDEAQALADLARCALAAGRTADAEDGLRQAQEIFQRIGAADADGVAAEVDALTQARPDAQKHPDFLR
jgi:tetratricopeptide (TPR) repeat protein/transcriptional regulator with XRE-family HTH domain